MRDLRVLAFSLFLSLASFANTTYNLRMETTTTNTAQEIHLSKDEYKFLLSHASKDKARPQFTCVYISEKGAFATDGHRFAIVQFDRDEPITGGECTPVTIGDVKAALKLTDRRSWLVAYKETSGIRFDVCSPDVRESFTASKLQTSFSPSSASKFLRASMPEATCGDQYVAINADYLKDVSLLQKAACSPYVNYGNYGFQGEQWFWADDPGGKRQWKSLIMPCRG